ncbi:transporter [Mycobacteroides chelonae]|uniref:transporter n=1 Tax=Mycobacteroides chelonae TaxID=1774 RepID=UPI0008A965D5|nr:transporter [Mycobacteroides chelonae]OHU23883.1 transporter [Mycobacteroides chelonae]
MRDLLFASADILMAAVGFVCGMKFVRRHRNYLLGLEMIIMGASASNFLLYGLLKHGQDSPMFHIAFFLDAFSRSIGFTLILVMGLLVLTHGYTPSLRTEVAAFALAAVFGFFLSKFAAEIGTPGKVFFFLAAIGTSILLCYFAFRLWRMGERTQAARVCTVTALNVVVASIYDFWHIPGDDARHTIFYTVALCTWGLTMLVIYRAYSAFDVRTAALTDRLTASATHIAGAGVA